MCDRVGVPALGQHRHRDDAAHIPPRRNALVQPQQRAIVVVAGHLLVMLAHQLRPLLRHPAARPFGLAHRFQDKAQPPGFVLGAALLDILDHLRVDAHRHLLARRIAEPGRRLAVAALTQRQPAMHLLGQRRIAADHDEHRRHRMPMLRLGRRLPFQEPLPPFAGQQIDRRAGIPHHQRRRQLAAEAIGLRPDLHPAPDVEIRRLVRARGVA